MKRINSKKEIRIKNNTEENFLRTLFKTGGRKMAKNKYDCLGRILMSFALFMGSVCFTMGHAQVQNDTHANNKQIITGDILYRQALKQLFTATGSKDRLDAIRIQAVGDYHAKYPELSDAFLVQIDQSLSIDSLVTAFEPLYIRHFSLEEIKELASFYKTPLGKKVMNEMPALMTEKNAVAANFYKAIQQRVERQLAIENSAANGNEENKVDK